MGRGKAHGANRDYQVRCRDVLVHRDPELAPFADDGIDVPFDIGGSTWTLDVALRKADGSLIVAEARRKTAPVKQEELAAFAYKVELLRKHFRVPVAGFFITKTAHQVGAVKAGEFAAISMVVLSQDAAPPGFSMVFHRYSAKREQRYREFVYHVGSGGLSFSGSVEAKLIKAPRRGDK